jgi:chemotaxis protein methyltransferase CheR
VLLREHFPALSHGGLQLVATDLSTAMLERCREGRYSQLEVNRGLPARLLVKYFSKQGMHWQVNDELRRAVEFRQMNLDEPWPALPPMDLVMLRNVLIYFDMDTKRSILARMRRLLRPGGFLILGGAETLLNVDDSFERITFGRATCYQVRAS